MRGEGTGNDKKGIRRGYSCFAELMRSLRVPDVSFGQEDDSSVPVEPAAPIVRAAGRGEGQNEVVHVEQPLRADFMDFI